MPKLVTLRAKSSKRRTSNRATSLLVYFFSQNINRFSTQIYFALCKSTSIWLHLISISVNLCKNADREVVPCLRPGAAATGPMESPCVIL